MIALLMLGVICATIVFILNIILNYKKEKKDVKNESSSNR